MRSRRLKLSKIYRGRRKRFTVIAIAAALLICSSYPFSFYPFSLASYIQSAVMNSYIATAEGDFYFTSDFLTDASSVPTYHITHNWNTDATISFKLKNYENLLNISDRQIAYTATASPGSSIAGAIDPSGLVGQSQTVNLTVPVPANTSAPLEVLVTATSTSPFAKTLQGRFIISSALSFEVAENTGSPVATLKVTLPQSSELTQAVAITWQEGAAPDMTNPIVINGTIDLVNRTITTTLNTAAVCELVFFKDSAAVNYTGVTAAGV
jgi:hypothetical protein